MRREVLRAGGAGLHERLAAAAPGRGASRRRRWRTRSSPAGPTTQRAIILNVQRQPGANVIQVADRVKALLPQLEASLPQGIHVTILSDRTETVRASVEDVEFTLVLTIFLVVAVIYVFLRNLRATTIPGIAVPLSLDRHLRADVPAGYSLNNLSLMALTISTGFVVDDAIVMIENISRFIEEGESPFRAAIKGAGQIGFTIVSLTVSLVAVLVPLLFMTGLIGRLFREFAVTLALAIGVSAMLSLTLTPMMCAWILKPEPPPEQRGRFYAWSERTFERVIAAYGRGRGLGAPAPAADPGHHHRHLPAHRGARLHHPQGLLPGAGHRAHHRHHRGRTRRELRADVGAAAGRSSRSSGRIRTWPAWPRSSAPTAPTPPPTAAGSRSPSGLATTRHRAPPQIIARLQPKLGRRWRASPLYLQAVQDLQIETRQSRTPVPVHARGRGPRRARRLGAEAARQAPRAPRAAERRHRPAGRGPVTLLSIDRDTASRLGITTQAIDDTLYDAFGQRQVSTIFTQLNLYRVILEVNPELAKGPRALDRIYVRTSDGAPGAALGGGAAGGDHGAAHREPPGAVPLGDALLRRGARATRWARR